MSIHKISCHIAQILSRELALGEDDSEVMAYGLEIILSSVTKLVVILSSAYFLNIFSTTLVALLTFSSFRLLSGGVHFSDYYRCLGFGLLIMLSLGKLAQIFILSQTFHLLVFTFVIGLSAFLLCLKWAPAENPNKILTDEDTG